LRKLPMHAEVLPADHHTVVYRCRSANYVQWFWHPAIDIQAAVAFCPIEAVKNLGTGTGTQKKLKQALF
jgi:hypothetical protein